MTEKEEALNNPFSPEKAYLTFRENMAAGARLREEVRQGRGTEREQLLKAAEALGRLTDNTILSRVIQKALEARETA